MRCPRLNFLLVLLSCLVLVLGCSKQDGQPVAVPSPDQQHSPPPAPTGSTAITQMSKAQSIHKAFAASLSATMSEGDTLEAVQKRLNLADKTRTATMLLRVDIDDPEAAGFLVRFTDGLDAYIDLARRHIATLEEVNRLYASGKEMQDNLSKLPDKEKSQATQKLNAVIDQHNSLAQGPLARERKELEDLLKELISLK
jgi:hypothetical protein